MAQNQNWKIQRTTNQWIFWIFTSGSNREQHCSMDEHSEKYLAEYYLTSGVKGRILKFNKYVSWKYICEISHLPGFASKHCTLRLPTPCTAIHHSQDSQLTTFFVLCMRMWGFWSWVTLHTAGISHLSPVIKLLQI